MNTPNRMLAGVWITHVKIMILTVIQSACGRAGSLSTPRQLVSPDGWTAPTRLKVVKDRNSTPTRGITANTVKNNSAGSVIHVTVAPLTAPPPPVVVCRAAAGGASAVIAR